MSPLDLSGHECESSPVVFLRLTCIQAVLGARSLSCLPPFELSGEKRTAHLSLDTWSVHEGSMASLIEDTGNMGWGGVEVTEVVGASLSSSAPEDL